MARQIINEKFSLSLPEYHDTVRFKLSPYQQYIYARFNITGQQRITLGGIEIEKLFLGKPVDIFGHIGEFSFIIYFIHPGRHVPKEFYKPKDTHCGILSISLEKMPELFLKANKQKKSYLKILYLFLANDLSSKRWIFHPRYEQRKEEALIKLQLQAEKNIEQKNKQKEKLNKSIKQSEEKQFYTTQKEPLYPAPKIEKIVLPEEIQIRKQANFECVLCHTRWQGPDPSDSPCPTCKTHLYRKRVSYVDE